MQQTCCRSESSDTLDLFHLTEWTTKLNEIYNNTINIPSEQQDQKIEIEKIVNLVCIDGVLHIPYGIIKSGIISEAQPNDNIYICGTIKTLTSIINTIVMNKHITLNGCSVYDINEMIYGIMAMGINNNEFINEFGKWLIDHKSERLDDIAETYLINSLLSHNKEIAYQLRDQLGLAENTQKVFSSMVLEEGISDISCSQESMGVIIGFVIENIIREGGEWYSELQKLLNKSITNREYIQPLIIGCWRLCNEDKCQKEFIESGCLKEVIEIIKSSTKEDIILIFIEITILLMQNESNFKSLEKFEVIKILIEIIKKNLSLKLMEMSGLRALSLYCGFEENNNKMIDNQWIEVIKNVMELYLSDEGIQSIGLNIFIKILSTKRCISRFIEIGVIDNVIQIFQIYKDSPGILLLCFQVYKEIVKNIKDTKILNIFPLIIQISHSFENDISIISGCMFIFSYIFSLSNTINFKTDDNIKWIFELAMKFIELEDIQNAVIQIVFSLINDKQINICKLNNCIIIVSFLVLQSTTIDQSIKIMKIIHYFLSNGVSNELLGQDIFNIITERMKKSDNEEVIVHSIQCLEDGINEDFSMNEKQIKKYENWVNICVNKCHTFNTPKINKKCLSLIKKYIEGYRSIDKLEDQEWRDIIFNNISQNQENIEIIKDALTLRVIANQIQPFFSYNEVIQIIQILETVIQKISNKEFDQLVLQICILFLCPFNQNVIQISQLLKKSILYKRIIQQIPSISNQLNVSVLQVLMTSLLLSNSYSIYSFISLNVWEVVSSLSNDPEISQLLNTTTSMNSFCNLIKQLPNSQTNCIGFYAIMSVTTLSSQDQQLMIQYAIQLLSTPSTSISERRNAILLFALLNNDSIKREESLIKKSLTSIINVLSEPHCPTDYVCVGVCALFNLAIIPSIRTLINTPNTKTILNNLIEENEDCKEIITKILKRVNEEGNHKGFSSQIDI
ncbi:hypothetical protein EDI_229060 [Entamoeba dispar SAW760]|uniref:Uncharacterized protein n=1 Tax=Entamoeba dispar (strain ATCC PRA-260 / SAW760) TaxID=370354 RepID=B0ELT5_ENTDS|nr:uncharacterized protein EDI_229060 [Entamoeba dispar SAW760]EDR24528.1 hypothetical protein EDI_229060 [Entamoeba dispar SAW760]|eukprot:EDR24528.1 hypothetical protein EDI_229060 [Entamoeba dispar SAW760]